MYNVVDTYFSGLISTEAQAAMSLSFPVFFVIIAFGSGISSGVTTLIAHALGEGKKEEAKEFAVQGFSFGILMSVVITIAGFLSAPSLFRLLGASDQYLQYAMAYISVIFAGAIFFVLAFICNAILSAVGDTKAFRNFLIAGFFVNFIFNYWFMYGGLGVPAFGIAGIALGTIVVEFFGVMYLVRKVMHTGLISRDFVHHLLPKWSVYRKIAGQGLPASLGMMTVGIGIFVITYFISGFGKVQVAANGIATRIEQIALLPLIGINIAVLTLVGQNRGAGKMDRVMEVIKKSIKYAVLIATIGAGFVVIFSGSLMDLFTNDSEVIMAGTKYLHIAGFMMWAYAILFITDSVFRGIKKPIFSLWLGLFRQMIAPATIFGLAVYVFHVDIISIWWGLFAIVWFSALLSLWYLNRTLKKIN
jgi:putative MATE family efflux protein